MAEEIAGLYVSIGADISGLESALEQTRQILSEVEGEGGFFGGWAAQLQGEMQAVVNGIQAGLAPLPDTLQKGIQEPVVKVLGSISQQVQKQMEALIHHLHNLARQIHSEALALGVKSPINIAHLEGRAEGGSVTGGRAYVVGEAGPELFVPGTSGAIVPNHALGGSGLNIRGGTFHFHGVQDAEAFYDSLQRVGRQRGA